MIKKSSYVLSSIVLVVLFWYLLGAGFVLKENSNSFSKLQCVSYAPFAKDESPFLFDKGLVISEELVRKDLELLSKYTDCIRTYSTVGLEMIPKIAKENNLKMLMGAWVSSDEVSTKKELDTLIKLAKEYSDITKAVIVGNEVLLRGDISDQQLFNYIKEVKTALPNIKVTYADVWEFWIKYPIIQKTTDFVTIHILPYWEDEPKGIEDAISHLALVRMEVEDLLQDKNILIGETGWPSEGRMREDALPSKINQAIFIREFVTLAEEKNWDYNIIEAFDQPWKRVSEGAVGGFWGLFDKDRLDKNVFKGDVSNFPNYKYLAFGSVFLVLMFSILLKNHNIENKKLFIFTIANTSFAILYLLQIEQYNITVRTNLEFIWAVLVLGTNLFIYYFLLLHILDKNKSKDIPISLFYLSFMFVLVSSINLAFEGRYRNFEIYIFIISALSFLWIYKDRIEERFFNNFIKLSSIILFITSVLIFINETYLNLFSNIWILISLIFAYILYKQSKDISINDSKTIIITTIVFFIGFIILKTELLSNKELVNQCNLVSDSFACNIRDTIGLMAYEGMFGVISILSVIIAILFNKQFLSYIALFFGVCAILLFNTFLGSIGFIIALFLLTKKR
uniref:glycoside hydrolase family 17 protein n=1 Tax=Aliarcobacter sp. TaxID=2321116 RepID=UPI004048DFFC